MIEPGIPPDEDKRLETLRALRILDSEPEERFDRLTRMAKRMFGVPISLVSIVDSNRQWFKSAQGLEVSETPRNISFCGHAILGDGLFMVPDTHQDERFADNPLVLGDPNIRFYAGCPLKVSNGHKMGTLCLIDQKPRQLSQEDQELLKDLAVMAEQEIAALQMATLDELTGISNRRGFISLGRHSLSLSRRNGHNAALIFIDLDEFKPINDTFGHAEGDRALVAFANLLRNEFRDSDVFARIGGDEFAVLMANTDDQGVKASLKRFKTAVDQYNQQASRGYDLDFSAGHVLRPATEDTPIEGLLERADELMYAVKRDSKKRGHSSALKTQSSSSALNGES